MKTRNYILEVSRNLFNKSGYGTVTMRQIADEIGVDRRNISYHFDKEGLLAALSNEMWTELSGYRNSKKDFPSFENLDKEVSLYNLLQVKYAFIFKDLNVIQHPLIFQKFKKFSETMISDSHQAVAFAIAQGNMKPEPIPGAYNSICTAVWTISMSWLQLNSLRNVTDLNQVRKLIWSLIVPHFTDKGVAAFETFFGKDFYQSLGTPFSTKVDKILF